MATLEELTRMQGIVEVELRGSAICRDRVRFGGRNGNVVTESSTPEVLKGWRVVALNGSAVEANVRAVQAAFTAAKRQSRYIVIFSTEGQRPPKRSRVKELSPAGKKMVETLFPTMPTPKAVELDEPLLNADEKEELSFEITSSEKVQAEPSSVEGIVAKATEELPPPPPPPPLPLERASSLRCPSLVYEEVRYLASGAFGSAFLVRRHTDGRHFVAKKCHIAGLDPGRRQVCLDEIGLLRRMRHNCVAEYVDFCWTSEARDGFWIVMKYYQGGDVQQRIESCRESDGKLDYVRVQTWLTQLCLALDYVHAFRIVHNDVKGSNMFISLADNIVLGDFGISEELEPDSPSSSSRAGSPAFMAPERWNGKGSSFASDMWSVGIVAYELTALRRPFKSHNVASLVYKLSSEDPEPLAEDVCPSDLWDLIVQLLGKRPENRPAAAEALKGKVLRGCVELLHCYQTHLEDYADTMQRLKDKVKEAEESIKRVLHPESSSESESEDDEPQPEDDNDDVLSIRVTNSRTLPPEALLESMTQQPPQCTPEYTPHFESSISDSWGGAEAVGSVTFNTLQTDGTTLMQPS